MEYVKGRPDDTARLEKELRCYDFLDSLGVEYLRVDHAPAETMSVCEEIDAALGCKMCKNLFLCNRQNTEFYLIMMPGDKPFRTKELSKQLGCSRLSFAPADKMEEFLDITPGSVSVLGLMNDKNNRVRLIIDRDILSDAAVGVHPAINTSSLNISTDDLISKIIPATGHDVTVVELPE